MRLLYVRLHYGRGGFLKINPNPTRGELAHGISGNLCRCQDYDKILTALIRGAENMREVNHVYPG